MKRLFTFFLTIVAMTFFLNAQNRAEDKLELANSLGKSMPDSAIAIFKEVMDEEPDTSIAFARAFFNIAVIQSMVGNIDSTTMWYNKIINSNLNDDHPGTGFFETYACYHHNAAIQLAIFLFHKQEYNAAIENFERALYEFPYKSTSGTSMGKRSNSIQLWISRCYQSIEDYESSVVTIINGLLDCYVPMQPELELELTVAIMKNGGTDKLKSKMKDALKSLESIGGFTHSIVGEKNRWKFQLYGQNVYVCINEKNATKQEVIDLLANTSWFPY